MKSFQTVKLKQQGLVGTTLATLGKVNVICGPNNSGKTTVLECLAEKDRHACSIPMSPEVKRNGGRIARAMALEDIAGTDLAAFIEQVSALASRGR